MKQINLQHPLPCHFASFLLGLVLVFAFAPFHFSLSAPLVIATFYLLYKKFIRRSQNKTHLFLFGWCFGFGLFIFGCHWIFISIYNHSQAGLWLSLILVVLLCAFLATFYGMFIFILSLIRTNCFSHQSSAINIREPLAFASLFVLFEYLRGWLFTGFPWLYLGYSQIDNALSGYAPVSGVLGISWFLVFTAVLLGQTLNCVYTGRLKRKNITAIIGNLSLIAGVWLGGYYLKSIDWTKPDTTRAPLNIISVQPDVAQEHKWSAKRFNRIKQKLAELSMTGLNKVKNAQTEPQQAINNKEPSQLIIWPEAALPTSWNRAQNYLRRFTRHLPAETWFMTGILSEQNNAWFNSLVLLNNSQSAADANAGVEQFYHKRKLVPFGEFIPLIDWLIPVSRWLSFNIPISDIQPGADNQPALHVGNHAMAPFICYEIVFPDLVTRHLDNSNYLLTISNDGWFGKSIGPHQHMQMARMRALENGLPLIRVTNTGITALTDHKGRIVKRLPDFVPAVDTYRVTGRTGHTPFHYMQSWAIVIISLLIVLSLSVINIFHAKNQKTH